jgi:hypothetical protein
MSESKIPFEQTLLDNLGKISYTLDRTYLSRLESDYGVLPFDENYNKDSRISYVSNIRALHVKRCVFDKEEKVSDCFKNVLGLFANSGDSLALVLRRSPSQTEMFFIVKNAGQGRNEDSKNNITLLADSLRGNFPGTNVEIIEERNSGEDTKAIFGFSNTKAVTVLSNVPSEKSKDFVSQGIEKLLNGVVPKSDEDSYTVVFLMESLSLVEVRNILHGYEEIATAITPFAGYQFQSGKSQTDTKGEMESLSHSKGISNSITKTHSLNLGFFVGVSIGGFIGGGSSAGYGYSRGKTKTISKTDTTISGTNNSVSLGESESTTYTYKSYMVSNLITKLEAVIKRIDESKSTGLWKYAAYIFSADMKTTNNVANFLRSISQGDESYIEPSFTQSWAFENSNAPTAFGEIQKYLSHFCHPVFGNKEDGTLVTPAIEASTTQLSNVVAFPRHSVQELPVLECVRFGREPHGLISLKKDVEIGNAYHMRQRESGRIFIDKYELTKHTFITGSTGSGKSNTVYTLLDKLCPQNDKVTGTKFLVIEPAKGEYKDIFGGRDDVTTYGTNPFKFPNLLQINPFSFPDDVHVLEHIDRLVEVFNACWPMYAAMPAILREAVEKAYELVDWNLKMSRNPGRFPTFETLLAVLPGVIESSEYSSDTSSDYKGALKTRVRSLTRGIHGLIFKDDIAPDVLFNQNVIVDISRVGSSETKALIMGILILKLQEYRMSENKNNVKELRHVTVLEEAHNLLRRTSSEQSQESSNLQGKSVEMLANAIAEMRTFGEGFIIVDQSPGLMDMSVIRNTNTKIILRLPDESDRMLVGKAAGLSDLQITELARLEVGVGAISQSDWLEPVLCNFDEFKDGFSLSKRYKGETFQLEDDEGDAIRQFLDEAFKPNDIERVKLSQDIADKVRAWYGTVRISESARSYIEMALSGDALSAEQKMIIAAVVTENRICRIPDRETVISEVTKALIGRYNFRENDEIIRRINDLFLAHFPANIYNDIAVSIDVRESEVK